MGQKGTPFAKVRTNLFNKNFEGLMEQKLIVMQIIIENDRKVHSIANLQKI